MDALRGGDELVVEQRRQLAGSRLPAHAALLHGLAPSVARHGAGLVVVVARLGAPARVDPRVEGPVGQVDAGHAVGERGFLQAVGGEPAAGVPRADGLANLAFRVGEGQQALGIDDVARPRVGHDRRGPAELAALRHAGGLEERDGLAALALHRGAVLREAALVVGNGAQRQRQIVLGHERPVAGQHRRRDRAAIRAHQRLPGGIPVGLGAARRAMMLVERRDLRSGRGRQAGYDSRNSSSAALVTRHAEPIFLPLRSPFSSVSSTSASVTPRAPATSAGVSTSGIGGG